MQYIWILYVLIYSLLKGSRGGMKKAALKRSSSGEILFFYTLLGFIFILPFSGDAFTLPPIYILYAFIKAAVVCSAWYCAFAALKNMSVSLYGIMDLARMVFSTLLGVVVLGEQMTLPKIVGMALVLLGLTLVNAKKNTESRSLSLKIFVAAMLNCFLNAISGTMDKVLTRTVTPSQLQFWFMFFMTLIYGGYLLVRKEKIRLGTLKRNYWIPLMSLSLVLGDRFLFMANADPASQVTLMTVIKQSSVIITVLTGWIFFKEKHILYKLMCVGIVLLGIFIAIFL